MDVLFLLSNPNPITPLSPPPFLWSRVVSTAQHSKSYRSVIHNYPPNSHRPIHFAMLKVPHYHPSIPVPGSVPEDSHVGSNVSCSCKLVLTPLGQLGWMNALLHKSLSVWCSAAAGGCSCFPLDTRWKRWTRNVASPFGRLLRGALN